MKNENLKRFYNLLAFGEFDQALKLHEESEGVITESDKIVVEALKLQKELKKHLSLKAF